MTENITREEAKTLFIKVVEGLSLVSDSMKKGEINIWNNIYHMDLVADLVWRLSQIVDLKNPDKTDNQEDHLVNTLTNIYNQVAQSVLDEIKCIDFNDIKDPNQIEKIIQKIEGFDVSKLTGKTRQEYETIRKELDIILIAVRD